MADQEFIEAAVRAHAARIPDQEFEDTAADLGLTFLRLLSAMRQCFIDGTLLTDGNPLEQAMETEGELFDGDEDEFMAALFGVGLSLLAVRLMMSDRSWDEEIAVLRQGVIVMAAGGLG